VERALGVADFQPVARKKRLRAVEVKVTEEAGLAREGVARQRLGELPTRMPV